MIRRGTQYLMERDLDILEFTLRYRVATDDMLAQQFFGLERRNTNVLRVTRKLVERKLLKRIMLCGSQSYLIPTRKACRAIGVLEQSPRPLTEQSLPAVLAIAYYCVRHEEQLMTTAEFIERLPKLHRPGLNSSRYYIFNEDGNTMLGMFLIDRGGTAHRIKNKVRKFVKQRESLEDFQCIIDCGRVQLTVLTGLEGQQRVVERYLGGESYWGVRVRTALVPELGELLTLK